MTELVSLARLRNCRSLRLHATAISGNSYDGARAIGSIAEVEMVWAPRYSDL